MTEMHIKQAEHLIQCLKEKNYLRLPKRRRRKIWQKLKPETLYRFAIVVQKNFNFDNITFEYKPEKRIFVRTKFTGNLENQTKEVYERYSKECRYCEIPCYKGEYTIEEFVYMITNGKFEVINIYPI